MEKLQIGIQEGIGRGAHSGIIHSGWWEHYGRPFGFQVAAAHLETRNQLFKKGMFESKKRAGLRFVQSVCPLTRCSALFRIAADHYRKEFIFVLSPKELGPERDA